MVDEFTLSRADGLCYQLPVLTEGPKPKGSKMPGYETTVVLRPGTTEEQTTQLKSKIDTIITSEGGQVLNAEDWGTRKMAFLRGRESKGHYHYFAYTGKTSTVAELERNLRINEQVMLYLSVRQNDGVSEEDLAALKAPSAMVTAKDRPPRDAGFGDGRRDRDFGDRPPRDFGDRPPRESRERGSRDDGGGRAGRE